MASLAEQRAAGWTIAAVALLLIAIGAWLARSGDTRFINGVDFSRIDARDHRRAVAIVGWHVAAIGASHLPVAAWLATATAPIEPEWLLVLVLALPPLLWIGTMFLRLQGLYRR